MKARVILTAAAAALLAAGCAQPAPKVTARAVPERADDFMWENDLVAGRIYGAGLERETLSPGIDVWVKRPGPLVTDGWYAEAQKDPAYYHHDHGEGKDCYKVGRSLGGGASVPLLENRFQYPATNYRSCEVLKKTAEEVSFVLHYPEWTGLDGVRFTLDKQVTLQAGSYFAKVVDTYTFTPEHGETMQIAAGIVRHDIGEEFAGTDRFAFWEEASDQSLEREDGMIGLAVYMPGAQYVTRSHGEDHTVCIREIRSGEPLTYYFGSCWSKGDIRTPEQWFELVRSLK